MKHLVVFRHGASYRPAEEKEEILRDTGIEQMTLLADKIRAAIKAETISFYPSTTTRARQCAEIVQQRLGGELKPAVKFLCEGWLDGFDLVRENEESEKLEFVLDADPAELVVMVTHLDRFDFLAQIALRTMGLRLDRRKEREITNCPHQGDAGWFDFETKQFRLI